ncbi:MAG: sulfatase-like hydrolase/transferase, partial [Planctomycetota bacterium]
MTKPTQTKLDRRNFLKLAGSALSAAALTACALPIQAPGKQKAKKPNFIIIFCDDLGYGDIGCFGSKKHRTPNIDKMADEGLRLTSFYVTSGVCTPSRSSLMTGCYPRRVNMHKDAAGFKVLFPVAQKGLNPNEITIAEVLKT